jgi:hypothetical protein
MNKIALNPTVAEIVEAVDVCVQRCPRRPVLRREASIMSM